MSGQFHLLSERRFGALFVTQFGGALNDNVFRSTLSFLLVYGSLVSSEHTNLMINLAMGLFILPFFLFSALAGQLADKYEKSQLIRRIKVAEIVVALLGAWAVINENVTMMLVVLFLLGTQSTFFGPLKYSILPQLLKPSELIGGNGQIEMGTFVAILLGTVIGGIVADLDDVSYLLSALVLAIAIAGYASARLIPVVPATAPDLVVDLNPLRSTWRLINMARNNRTVLLSILGISWFWFMGSAILAQIPNTARIHLAGDTSVGTLVLCTFTVAIAVGSLACERLAAGRIEIGLVPMGAALLSIAGIDFYFSVSALPALETGIGLRNWLEFLALDGSFRVLIDVMLIGLSGGLFIVPLYALIQSRTPESERARIIAVNNVLNSVLMVISSMSAILFLSVLDFTIPEFLLIVALMNVAVSVFIFHQVPEFAMRFLIWIISHGMYRVRHESLDSIPAIGGAVLVSNHVSYVDALLLAGAVPRPIRFIMFKPIFDIPVLNFVFRTGGAVPIISPKEDAVAYETAMAEIAHGLEQGDLMCIFPEGKLSHDGEIDEFKAGVERIVTATPVPVVPMALKGLWGSFFSRDGGLFSKPKRFWSRIDVVAGEAVPAANVNAVDLRARVAELRGDAR